MNEEDLKQLIQEQFALILLEQEDNPEGDEPDEVSSSSVDEQIDKLLCNTKSFPFQTKNRLFKR